MPKEEYILRKEIIEVGRRLHQKNFVAANDGNISARIDSHRILITPTTVSKGFMNPAELVIVDLSGRVIDGRKKPSSEMGMHLRIYRERNDVMSVCHAHPPTATGFAVAGIPLDENVLPEVVVALGNVPLLEYKTQGTGELTNIVGNAFKKYDAVLMSNHGVVTSGEDVFSAYYKMETVEHYAKIILTARNLGNINRLPDEEIIKLREQRAKFGIRKDLSE